MIGGLIGKELCLLGLLESFLYTLVSDMSSFQHGSFWGLLFEDPLLYSEPAWDHAQPVTAIIQLLYNPGRSFLGKPFPTSVPPFVFLFLHH